MRAQPGERECARDVRQAHLFLIVSATVESEGTVRRWQKRFSIWNAVSTASIGYCGRAWRLRSLHDRHFGCNTRHIGLDRRNC
jgi:hypothetical protein